MKCTRLLKVVQHILNLGTWKILFLPYIDTYNSRLHKVHNIHNLLPTYTETKMILKFLRGFQNSFFFIFHFFKNFLKTFSFLYAIWTTRIVTLGL